MYTSIAYIPGEKQMYPSFSCGASRYYRPFPPCCPRCTWIHTLWHLRRTCGMFHSLVSYTSLGWPALSQQEESGIPDDSWEIRIALALFVPYFAYLVACRPLTHTYTGAENMNRQERKKKKRRRRMRRKNRTTTR
jgi:hypothetical protein